MKNLFLVIGSAAVLAAVGAGPATAEPVFNRIATWPVSANLPTGADRARETSAEIIEATGDGMMVVYTDSPLGAIGMIDITDPKSPKPAGMVELGGEPTSLAIIAGRALVVVDTTRKFTEPAGHLAVVDLASRTIVKTCDLGGQPDSVALSPDKSILAVAIENQRDEGLRDGAMPQLPPGNLIIFSLSDGELQCGARKVVDLTGLAQVAPSDPEPEFVDINAANEIVVTLQENNHLVVIDGRAGAVVNHFSAGAVDLENIDVEADGALHFDGSQRDRRREPDAVKWLDENRFVVANEGDYEGGTRGFTIFSKHGPILWDSGPSLEYQIAAIGHYPEKRSGKQGIEAEGVEVGSFGAQRYIFVTAERASVVGVYRDTGEHPELVQLLPSGISPESAVAIPSRNLLVTANETDLIEDDGVRAHVMIYELQDVAPAYPQIRSLTTGDGPPIGWGALSGLAADPARPGILYAVNDRFYRRQPTIFTVDATTRPATITKALRVTRNGSPARKLDLEGIASDGRGGFWLASEGGPSGKKSHTVYHVDATGEIDREVELPPELEKVARRHGFEGITSIGVGDDLTLWIAVQREWKDDEDGYVKLLSYHPNSGKWGAVRYPLDRAETGRVGLSAITAHGGHLYVVERDNGIDDAARIKKLYRVDLRGLTPSGLGEELPTVTKHKSRDLIPYLKALNGYVTDKVEGFAVDASGVGYAVTDNDGVSESSGETLFFSVGRM